jgi:Flp pilus assembly protein TadD
MVNRGLAQYALEPLQTAVKLDPKHARARFYLGEAYVRLGSLDKAQSQFLALTELDPERAVVLKKKMDAAREKSGKK